MPCTGTLAAGFAGGFAGGFAAAVVSRCICTQGELNDVLIGGGALVLQIHIYKERKVCVQDVYTMYKVYLQVLGETPF